VERGGRSSRAGGCATRRGASRGRASRGQWGSGR
jgi:hypothetical protein